MFYVAFIFANYPLTHFLHFRFGKICVGGNWIVTDIRLASVEACIMNARLYALISVYITSVFEKICIYSDAIHDIDLIAYS